jgi:hypothetical protein
MQTIATIGLDIAKSVFQVHGVDAAGQVVVRRQLKRRQVLGFFAKLSPSLIGIEACASSHYWARQLQALGHTVRLIPPAYVKPYVKRQKNDAADAEAIRGGHYGQRPRVPRSKAEHMAAPTCCTREENPCQPGAVHTWPQPGSVGRCEESPVAGIGVDPLGACKATPGVT